MPLLRVEGEVDSPRHFDFHDLAALPGQVVEVGTLLPGREGSAVQLRALLDPVGIKQTATHIPCRRRMIAALPVYHSQP
jgi:hypothetical protein